MHEWNYTDESGHGPRDWPRQFNAGKFQSPINILVDFCDLSRQPARASCSCPLEDGGTSHHHHHSRQHLLSARLKQALNLETADEKRHENRARDHLDSVGNELDSDYVHADSNRSPSTSSDMSNFTNDSVEECKCERRRQQQQAADRKRLRQSTRYCVTNKKLFLGYPRYLNSVKLSHTGHAWQVDLAPELACHTLLCGPPFGDREYRLAQFHCHWGEDCSSGSEHQINGQSYSAEIHFVHWNCSQFKSAEEAARHKHGLTVLGVFVQALEGDHNRNKHLDKIIGGLDAVGARPGSSVELTNTRLDLKKLFPVNRWQYATYEGSLTTPPLSEVVDWVLFLQPIQCSAGQLQQFRQMRCPEGALLRNCRPIQPLNSRTVTIWTHSHAH